MKVIFNRFVPFRGFAAINLFGICFVRNGCVPDSLMLNHEAIHTAQMKEMGYVFFYLWYLAEWLVRLLKKGNAYRNISFEREAYANQNQGKYLASRPHYAWLKYIKKRSVSPDDL